MPTLTITGNIVRDPELRFTPSGKAVANLTVAENHRRRTAEGAWEDLPTTYWPVAVWGEYAEHLAEALTAAARVVVVGRTGTHDPDRGRAGRAGAAAPRGRRRRGRAEPAVDHGKGQQGRAPSR